MKQILIHLKKLKLLRVCSLTAMKLEINNNRKYPNILELIFLFLTNQWLKEELMRKIQNDHENRTLKCVRYSQSTVCLCVCVCVCVRGRHVIYNFNTCTRKQD